MLLHIIIKLLKNGLIKHFKEIAKSTTLPIILYNVPGRTGLNIAPKTCKVLSQIPNIVAIKEASGNISQIAEISELCGDELFIYSGNDDQVLPVLSLGGIGVISVLSNILPNQTQKMVRSFFEGDIKTSTKMQIDFLPIIHNLFSEVNPIPVKSALEFMGYNVGKPRLPLIEMSESGKNSLKQAMQEYGIIKQ